MGTKTRQSKRPKCQSKKAEEWQKTITKARWEKRKNKSQPSKKTPKEHNADDIISLFPELKNLDKSPLKVSSPMMNTLKEEMIYDLDEVESEKRNTLYEFFNNIEKIFGDSESSHSHSNTLRK